MTQAARLRNILKKGSVVIGLATLFCCCSGNPSADDPTGRLAGEWKSVRVDGAVSMMLFDDDELTESFKSPDEQPEAYTSKITRLTPTSFTTKGDTIYYRVTPSDSILYIYNDSADYVRDVPVEIYRR